MKPAPYIRIGCALAVLLTHAQAQEEEFQLTQFPPGIVLLDAKEISKDKIAAIEKLLSGKLDRLGNGTLRVHGVAIRLNMLYAASPEDAEKLHRTISASKGHPAFCVRRGKFVAEYVSANPDPAVALKASWELGLTPKPAKIHYRVTAEIVPVKAGSAESANELFNQLILASLGKAQPAEIEKLKAELTFGDQLRFREGVAPQLDPAAAAEANDVYTFPPLTGRFGVPAVRATMELTTPELLPPSQPGAVCLQATEAWPVKDPFFQDLAVKISQGHDTPQAKVQALLEWLAPNGPNLRYGGQEGSRLGTMTAVSERTGRCWDFSDVFVTAARAAGIPARQVAGWLYGVSGHVWAEYHDGTRWVQVDPTGGGKLACGLYHLPYFTTETGEMPPILYAGMPAVEVIRTE